MPLCALILLSLCTQFNFKDARHSVVGPNYSHAAEVTHKIPNSAA